MSYTRTNKHLSNTEILDAVRGATVVAVSGAVKGSKLVAFTFADGRVLQMYHEDACCEAVDVEDVVGDWEDLIGAPLTKAEESCSSDTPPPKERGDESYTWSFYHFATVKGYVTFRWFGESNGYYSETVTCELRHPDRTLWRGTASC